MRKMAETLHKADENKATAILPDAPGPELQYKEVGKAWRKIKAANAL